MSDFMRYVVLVIFVVVVISIIWVLRDGFTIRSGGGLSRTEISPTPNHLRFMRSMKHNC